ncbi:hypothetical protein ABZY06_27635 [Streptomyces sp. NPDC006540]|jgi:hypothetical protein|uniref:hypothetical protein n=1 Tax=Streptomyces sp. NPDC006540 TaxID=3155353 RepID=UPI0033A896F1
MRAKTGRIPALGAVCALLLTTAACTSGDDEGPGRSQGAPPSGTSAATDSGKGGGPGGDASVPLTAPELERAALTTKDLTGFQVSTGKSALAASGQPTADKARCRPLADAMGDAPDGRARHTVNRGLGSLDELGLAISASLSSYSETDAKKLMDGLEAAIAACGGGFEATLDGRDASYREVKAAPLTVRGGDETVGWTTVATGEHGVSPVHLVVVRKGATVARFMAFDLAGRKPPRVPGAVADKQLAKVAQVLAG